MDSGPPSALVVAHQANPGAWQGFGTREIGNDAEIAPVGAPGWRECWNTSRPLPNTVAHRRTSPTRRRPLPSIAEHCCPLPNITAPPLLTLLPVVARTAAYTAPFAETNAAAPSSPSTLPAKLLPASSPTSLLSPSPKLPPTPLPTSLPEGGGRLASFVRVRPRSAFRACAPVAEDCMHC